MAGTIAASYSRYSSKLQSEESIEDQQRKCRERAEANGHQLRPEFEFADSETSGALRDREGLDALLEGARQGRFHVVYFHSLSRLARESIISMSVLKDLVYNHKIRVVASRRESIRPSTAGRCWRLSSAFSMSNISEN